LCSFEDWENPAVQKTFAPSHFESVFRSVRSLKDFVESKGLYYLEVPGAGVGPLKAKPDFPIDLFSAFTEQLNPGPFYDEHTMGEVFRAHSALPQTGIEMNVWSQQLLISRLNHEQPRENLTNARILRVIPNEHLVAAWQRLQRDAVLRFRPHLVTWEYYEGIAFPAYERIQYYDARGWAMSINAMLKDPRISLYDPMQSRNSTIAVGGIPDPELAYTGGGCDAFNPKLGGYSARITPGKSIAYPKAATAGALSGFQGSVSLWIRPLAAAAPQSDRILASACSQLDAPNCFLLQLTSDRQLGFSLTDDRQQRAAVSADVSSWTGQNWHQVGATWNGLRGQVRLFIDGRMVTEKRGAWHAFPFHDPFVAGNLTPRGDFAANADIDDLRLYKTDLAPAEMQAIYQNFLRAGIVNGAVRPDCPPVG
jgi:hypothetical protein